MEPKFKKRKELEPISRKSQTIPNPNVVSSSYLYISNFLWHCRCVKLHLPGISFVSFFLIVHFHELPVTIDCMLFLLSYVV